MVNFSSLPEDVTSIIIKCYLSHKDKCALRLTSKRLSEKVIEVDPVFCKLLIPVSLCSQEDQEIKDITVLTQDKPPNNKGSNQEITEILLFLKRIKDKSCYARRIDTDKLIITLKVQCSTKKNKGFGSPVCRHSFPPIFSEWRDFVNKVEFHCAYDIKEPLDFFLAQFPKIEILSLTKVFTTFPQQLSNLNSETIVQLELKSDFFGNGAYFDINAATDFGLPNLKYLSLIGKNCLLYDEILDLYGSQLVGLNYLVSDSENSREREFPDLKYLCYSCRTADMPWFCPNLEFICLTYNSPVIQELPNLQYLAYTMAGPFITEVVRTNKEEVIDLYLMGNNYNLPPTNYVEGNYTAPPGKVRYYSENHDDWKDDMYKFFGRHPAAIRLVNGVISISSP